MNVLSAIAVSPITLQHYLVLGAVLFVAGVLTILLKRNAIGILMGVELVLNAANVNLVAFNNFAHGGASGAPALAAEAAVALAIFLNFYNNFATIDVERAKELKG